MQEFLRRALIDLADSVDHVELWGRIEEQVAREGTTLSADDILEAIHEGRR